MESIATNDACRRCASSIVIFSLVLLLTSCAATGEPFKRGEEVPGQSSLYIYRLHAMTGAAFAWDVLLDGEKLTELRVGGYFYSTLSPGPHTISVKVSRGLSLNIITEPDQPYYFRLRAGTDLAYHRFVLERVPENEAMNELNEMKLQPVIK